MSPRWYPLPVSLQRLLPKSWLEWLLVASILTFLVALLVPSVKWASSGTIEAVVRVVVFDAETAEPVPNAEVAIVRLLPTTGHRDLSEYHTPLSSAWGQFTEGQIRHKTDAAGIANIPTEFGTGASHVHPESQAHTSFYWILVSTTDHGKCAIPLRYVSIPTKTLRQNGVVPAHVGLARQE
jgi:hypothetical protein